METPNRKTISFITYHDGTEPYVTMADRLRRSVTTLDAGICHVYEMRPNGGDLFTELLGDGYRLFTDSIMHGPVVLLDADCILQKPIDVVFETVDFDLAAVYRGKVSNSYGTHNFLSTVAIFNDLRPEVARYLWLDWASRIQSFSVVEMQKPKDAKPRNERFIERGWAPTWYSDQAALNDTITEAAGLGIVTMPLDRERFAAPPGTDDAYIVHAKGKGKLKDKGE